MSLRGSVRQPGSSIGGAEQPPPTEGVVAAECYKITPVRGAVDSQHMKQPTPSHLLTFSQYTHSPFFAVQAPPTGGGSNTSLPGPARPHSHGGSITMIKYTALKVHLKSCGRADKLHLKPSHILWPPDSGLVHWLCRALQAEAAARGEQEGVLPLSEVPEEEAMHPTATSLIPVVGGLSAPYAEWTHYHCLPRVQGPGGAGTCSVLSMFPVAF